MAIWRNKATGLVPWSTGPIAFTKMVGGFAGANDTLPSPHGVTYAGTHERLAAFISFVADVVR